MSINDSGVLSVWNFCVGFVVEAVRSGDYTFVSARMRWTEHVARMGDRRGAYRILVGRHEGK